MKTTEPIRDKSEVNELTAYFLERGELRNHLLIVMGIHTALRIGDLLRLNWEDVYDFRARSPRASVTLTEAKTGKSKSVALNQAVTTALNRCAAAALPSEPLFRNSRTGKAISRVQAYRVIRAASEALALKCRVSCHSLRKTFGYHAWKGGASPAVIMDIYNHSSLAVTRRYLGVNQDDRDAVYLGMAFAANPPPRTIAPHHSLKHNIV